MRTQHSAYRQFRSVFGIAKIPNTDDLVDSDSSELRLKLRSKLDWQELRPKDRYFNWLLINAVIEIDFSGDHLVNKIYNFKRYTIHLHFVNGIRKHNADST